MDAHFCDFFWWRECGLWDSVTCWIHLPLVRMKGLILWPPDLGNRWGNWEEGTCHSEWTSWEWVMYDQWTSVRLGGAIPPCGSFILVQSSCLNIRSHGSRWTQAAPGKIPKIPARGSWSSTLCPWLRSPWQQDQRPAGKLQLFMASAGKLACSQLCPPEISSQHWEPRFEPAHPLNSFVLCPQSVPRLTCPTIRFLTRGQKKMEVVARPPGKVWLCCLAFVGLFSS